MTFFLKYGPVLGLTNSGTLSLQSGETLKNYCPGYEAKLSDDDVLVMREFWGMRSTPSLPLLPGPL